MIEVPLTSGKVALIDDADYELICRIRCPVRTNLFYRWHVCGTLQRPYAAATLPGKDGIARMTYMHRFILNAPDDMQVDHVDGDGLNNQRSNIRLATQSQNTCLRIVPKRKQITKYRGIEPHKNRWRATIMFNHKKFRLGIFSTEKQAALAYDVAAQIIQGEFAVLNFPELG